MADTTSNTIILLIEDNPLLTEMYKAAFEKSGFEVLLAHDGETGMTLAKQRMPSGILLDLLMPGMDGFEVLKKLKEDPNTTTIKTVVLTSDVKQEDLNKATAFGAVACLSKSELTLADIVTKVQTLFQ